MAFLVVVAGMFAGLTGRRIVMRSDNAPTVQAVNKHGSSKPPMGAAMRAVDAACEAFCIEVIMLHIPGRRNVIADAYSRGAIDEANRLLRRLAGCEPEIVPLPAEWLSGPPMRELERVSKRWRPSGVAHGGVY